MYIPLARLPFKTVLINSCAQKMILGSVSQLVLDLRAVHDSMKRGDYKEWFFDKIPAGVGPRFKLEHSALVRKQEEKTD